MIAIVGLGNIGDKYKNTRHNIGFLVVDYIAQKANIEFSEHKKLQVKIAKTEDLILAKPTTMMNSSGRAISSLLGFYSISRENTFIVHDDLDIRLGAYKIQKGVGPKIHNGINSIEEVLGVSDFWRVRIGVDNREAENRIDGHSYVLQNFNDEEMKIISGIIVNASKQILEKVEDGR